MRLTTYATEGTHSFTVVENAIYDMQNMQNGRCMVGQDCSFSPYVTVLRALYAQN